MHHTPLIEVIVFPARVYRSVLGTPTESNWPNVTDLDDWNIGFPKWPRIGLQREYKDLGLEGINMLEVGLGRALCFFVEASASL